MKNPEQWTVDASDVGTRFDLFLNEKLADVSRSQIQKAIKRGEFLLNGEMATVHAFLKEGDVITRHETRDAGHVEKKVQNIKLPALEVIEETDTFLVINKPAGILAHPDSVTPSGTLIDMLLAHDPALAKIGEDPRRPAIVHRLDKDVSGLMLVAKTPESYDYFKHLFKERLINKTYLAFVHGEPPQNEGDIRFRIARSSTSARMAARPEQEEAGKAAWTHYLVLERFRGASLVEVQIVSGRTHQIRAHFFALGNPVIGDKLYKGKHTTRKIDAPRLMLQSVGLVFTDPATDEEKKYFLAPDPSFDALKEALR